MNTYQRGDRVSTSRGPGTVAYQRMAPPDYCEVDAVSVVLDSERTRLGYAGTIFRAADVTAEPRPEDRSRHFLGWTYGDGTSTEGYTVSAYYDVNGRYMGPDQHGIEPIFEEGK